jgi:CRISPR-associated endonuclease Cas3-HD
MSKPCAGVGQSLYNHSVEVSIIAEKAFSKNEKVVQRKLNSLFVGKDINAKKIVKLASLLHDVGKAAYIYQKFFDDNCDCKNPSFAFHEIPSACFAANFKYSICRMLGFNLEETILTGLVILFHMHASRDFEDMTDFLKNKIKYKYWDLSPYKYTILQIIKQYDPNFDKNIDVLLKIDVQQTIDYVESYQKILNDARNYLYKIYTLLLNPIVIGDNLSAKNRKQDESQNRNRSHFIKELEVMTNE